MLVFLDLVGEWLEWIFNVLIIASEYGWWLFQFMLGVMFFVIGFSTLWLWVVLIVCGDRWREVADRVMEFILKK